MCKVAPFSIGLSTFINLSGLAKPLAWAQGSVCCWCCTAGPDKPLPMDLPRLLELDK